ncbi:hypothetical protein ACPUYX_19625 [Desulfosporosinus sp. SYSU MS00001]|uniref:hypothetical protein n=1 Tax=Desulfosporosinus sp. SYSU MS00001 TaxID=3416284 RepID=UPI003CF610F1
MEIEKFQEFLADQFSKMFKEIRELRAELKNDVNVVERLDRIEAKVEVLQLETSHIRRQNIKEVHSIEQMQLDINYLVRKTTYHDDEILQLKKEKEAQNKIHATQIEELQYEARIAARKLNIHDDEILQLKKAK